MDVATSKGDTALHWAAMNGHLEVVKYLLSRGASSDRPNKLGGKEAQKAVRMRLIDRVPLDTPLICAAWKSHGDICKELLRVWLSYFH